MDFRSAFSRKTIERFLSILFLFFSQIFVLPAFVSAETFNSLLGPRIQKQSKWVGNQVVSPSISILVMAGHADSQGIKGEGTPGEAVALKGALPMDKAISDELFWNLQVRDAVVQLGKKKGLVISSYDPGVRTIVNENHHLTNWSAGSRHAAQGGYVLEIHFDSFGEYGLGSGLIPALSKNINNIDEALAQSFGRYPLFFRGGLGGPRRQIRILEIGKLEGKLEQNLRNSDLREKTIHQIANQIVQAILIGVNKQEPFNPRLQEEDIFLPDFHL